MIENRLGGVKMGNIHYMSTEEEMGNIKEEMNHWEERLGVSLRHEELEGDTYLKEDLCLLECIIKLSNAGVCDDELKEMIPELLKAKEQKIEVRGVAVAETEITTNMTEVNMAIIMERVLQNNNVLLEQGICDVVTESIKKEMTYLLLAKDQVEEERYKRLDTLIRQQQLNRKESARKAMPWFSRERFGFTG